MALSAVGRRLEGKVALITGGASGVGESIARLFSQHGSKVIIADIQDDLGHSICKDLGPPTSASFIHCNVTKEQDVENAVNTAVTKHGKLDVMVNNAGIADPVKPSILDNEKEDFDKILAINVTGVFLGTKHAARAMIPARQGNIVNVASVCSIVGGVSTHAYTCSKHAVEGLTKNTAVELGRYGIRVNCVSPYVVETETAKRFFTGDENGCKVGLSDIHKNVLDGRVLKGQDVAEALVYLASDESSRYVSGHNLVVDGGFTTGIKLFF